MAGRPWYVQGADLVHRLTVLGILGYSGYLSYGIVRAVKHNNDVKQRKILLANDPNQQQPEGEFKESE